VRKRKLISTERKKIRPGNTNHTTAATEEDVRRCLPPRSTHGRRSGAVSKQIQGGGTERKPAGEGSYRDGHQLSNTAGLSCRWTKGDEGHRDEGRRRNGGQRQLIKVADFTGGGGAQRFPPSRASPPKPPATAPKSPRIGPPRAARSHAPRKRTLASFPIAKRSCPFCICAPWLRSGPAAPNTGVPTHGCSPAAGPRLQTRHKRFEYLPSSFFWLKGYNGLV
jgi:hypothetical protein